MKSASRVAVVGLLGSFESPSPVRKGLHADTATAAASAICKDRFMLASRLAIESEGEHERAGLRVVEVINARDRRDCTTKARFRIVAGVLRPRVQVASRHADVHAADTKRPHYPRRVNRVRHRDFAQLHKPPIFNARLVDSVKGAGGETGPRVAVPVLSDRNGRARPWSHDGTVPPPPLAECAHRATCLCVLVSSIAVERASGAVPNLAAVADVQETRYLHLTKAEGAANVAGPAGIWIGQDTRVRIGNRETGGADVESSSG